MSKKIEIPGLEIPNVDALTNEELFVLENQLDQLRRYVSCVQTARRFRLKGRIPLATHYEREADDIYECLGDQFRW